MSNLIPPLKEYLEAIGVSEKTSLEQITFHKEQHRKLYQKAYSIQRRKKVVRVEHTLSKMEYHKFKSFAKRYKRKALNRFILDCAMAYLENEYVDHDETLIREYLNQIRAIGHNINQVVHQLHREKKYEHKGAYEYLQKRIDELYDTVHVFMKTPPQIKTILEKLFEDVPESIVDFERFLEKQKLDNDNQKYN